MHKNNIRIVIELNRNILEWYKNVIKKEWNFIEMNRNEQELVQKTLES